MKKVLLAGLLMGLAALVISMTRRRPSPLPRWAGEQGLGGTIGHLHENTKSAIDTRPDDEMLAREGLVDQALGAVRAGVGRSPTALDEAARE